MKHPCRRALTHVNGILSGTSRDTYFLDGTLAIAPMYKWGGP